MTKILTGNIRKMRTLLAKPVQYHLPISNSLIAMNDLVGNQIAIEFLGTINCVHCGRETKKSFAQGYCFPCFKTRAECDLCIVRPETCHYHQQTCRDPEWGQNYCMQGHVVYLANSSSVKVGITRATQIPTRWIDQGASQALPIYAVKNRYHSGLVEVVFKKYVADKTNWRRLLKGDAEPIDLIAMRDELLNQVGQEIAVLKNQYADFEIEQPGLEPTEIDYPVEAYPEKINSIDLHKTPQISGVLQGIKGQYLILDCGVLNVRKYGGYKISVSGVM